VKRAIVVVVTFVAGLFYFLEFLLPARVGGAIDSGGASAATRAPSGGGSGGLLLTGRRDDGPPHILSLDTSGTGLRVAIGPSPWRRDDYRGAQRPQWVAPDRLYYIGLGWDDRTPRICVAFWRQGSWRPEPRAVLDRGRPGTPDASGASWVSVLAPTADERRWRMWYVGRQGDTARVLHATSEDGRQWSRAGLAMDAPPGGSIESVSVWRSGEGLLSLLVRRTRAGNREVALAPVDTTTGRIGSASTVEVRTPTGDALLTVLDARADEPLPAAGPVRVLLSCARTGGRSEVRAGALSLVPRASLSVSSIPLRSPGRMGRSTLLSDVRGQVDDLLVVVGAFAVGLGLVSLAQVHGRRVFQRRKGWAESLVFFVSAAAMATATIATRLRPDADDWVARAYDLLFSGLFQPLGSTMFSLLAAYLVSAAYRAFKVRSLESTLMAAAAALIMVGQVPIGNLITQWLPPPAQIPTVMAWVLFVTNNAVVRAVNFGIFVGAIATALRVWLSLDRAALQDVA